MTNRPPQPPARPAQDEWGVYDPQQAGIAALFARIDSKAAKARAIAKADQASVQPTTLPRPALRDAT